MRISLEFFRAAEDRPAALFVAWMLVPIVSDQLLRTEIGYAGREASASPAVGALARHKREQARLIADAFSM